jgi:hypothetical protein
VDIALIVTAIAALAAVLATLVQRTGTAYAAGVGARQKSAEAGIELCDRLAEHLAEAGQGANQYGLELNEEFLKDWDARRALVHRILTAHGRAFAVLAALPKDSEARVRVQRALDVIAALPSVGEETSDLLEAWSRDRNAIPEALDAIGRERAYHLRRLEASARNPSQRQWVERTAPRIAPPDSRDVGSETVSTGGSPEAP